MEVRKRKEGWAGREVRLGGPRPHDVNVNNGTKKSESKRTVGHRHGKRKSKQKSDDHVSFCAVGSTTYKVVVESGCFRGGERAEETTR